MATRVIQVVADSPVREGDVLRYSASGGMLSVRAIVTIGVLLRVGVLLLVYARSGWLALGAAAMFAMAAASSVLRAVGNLVEMMLLAGLAMAARGMAARVHSVRTGRVAPTGVVVPNNSADATLTLRHSSAASQRFRRQPEGDR